MGPAHHAKTCLRAYADGKIPDQSAHSRGLIRVFTVGEQNHQIVVDGLRISTFCTCSKASFDMKRFICSQSFLTYIQDWILMDIS